MCGIAGLLTFDAADPGAAARAVDAMLPAIRHRGPDGEGRWSSATASGSAVALGHTRLAIIDLSEGGRQPMVRGRTAVTFNGEIYNYRALKEQLGGAGATFTTGSDTEVLLAAYARWGAAAVDHLDGMFAFGLWDATEDRLLLARDRFGIKPLYYHRGPGHIVFASEVRAILATGLVQPELDIDSVWHYLGYQTAPTPATLLRDIHLLEPGHHMEVRGDGRVTSRRYWSLLKPAVETPAPTVAGAAERVRELLHEAVSSHMVSDVPVGVFLSGGIDSGALVSMLHSIGAQPRTFTVGFAEDPAADESAEARRVADAFGTDHTEIRIQLSEVLEMMPGALAAVDHPSGDGINTFVVSKAVRDRGLKVALSGLGGDEIFGGYPSFRRLGKIGPAARGWGHSPAALRQAAAGLIRTAGGGRIAADKAAAVLESDGSIAQMWPVTRQLFSARDRDRLMAGRHGRAAAPPDAYADLLERAYAGAPGSGHWAQVSFAETRAYMHDVLLRDADQMSMAHALEVRVPLLDHHLAEYVVALPDAIKSDGRWPKSLLVNALPRPLPGDIARRPKRGFALPFDAWMRGPLRTWCEAQLGEQGLDGRGLCAPGAATHLWSRFIERAHGVTWSRVWSLVALNAWLDRLAVRVR